MAKIRLQLRGYNKTPLQINPKVQNELNPEYRGIRIISSECEINCCYKNLNGVTTDFRKNFNKFV